MASFLIRTAAFLCLLRASSAQTTTVPAVGSSSDSDTNETNPYIEEEDRLVLRDAVSAEDRFCAGVVPMTNEERAKRRQELLDGMGGTNIVKEILVESTSSSDMGSKAQAKILNPNWILATAAPLVMSLVMATLWYYFCWTCCPCCRCCRICRRTRRCDSKVRIVVPITLAGIVIGVLTCVGLAAEGHNTTSDGVKSASCTSSRMLRTVLGGRSGEKAFIGMMGVMETFWTLDQKLEDDSDFLEELNALLDKTDIISKANEVAGRTLQLISASMAEPGNVAPKGAAGEDLLHKCQFCTQVAPAISKVSGALDSGIASALANARSEISSQFGPASRRDLQTTMRQATEPMISLKKTLRDSFAPLVKSNDIEVIQAFVDTQLFAGMLVAFILAALLLVCGGISGVLFAVRDKAPEPQSKKWDMPNPYYKTVSRCAACSWQCGFAFTMLAFFLGGVITVFTVPLSGLCLTLDEMDRPLLENVASAVGLELSGDQGAMLFDLTEKCILSRDARANPNMFDILYTRENETAPKVFMRDRLVGAVKEPIDEQFSKIKGTASNTSMNLSSTEGVVALRKLFELNDIRGLVVADAEAMQNNNKLSGLVADSRADGVTVGFATSALCADLAVQGNLSGVASTIQGIDNFVAKLSYFGPIAPYATCAKQATCPTAVSAAKTACEAGNEYIAIKRSVMGATYRCDLFEDPANPASWCDPKDMSRQADGTWTNDCLKPDGTMGVKQKPCTFADFAAYAKDHDVRLQRIMERLDIAVGATFDDILVGLQSLVDKHVIDNIQNMTDGVTCGFLPEAYRGSIDSVCFQGLVGFRRLANSYVGCAIVVILLMVVMYGTWRAQIDLINQWDYENDVRMDQVVPMESMETEEPFP